MVDLRNLERQTLKLDRMLEDTIQRYLVSGNVDLDISFW